MDKGPPGPDVIEQGSRLKRPRLPSPGWRPSRAAAILAAVTLAMGLAAGYGLGRGTIAATRKPAAPTGQASTGATSRTAAAAAPPASVDFGPVLTEAAGTCSVQAGRDLELGIPVTNESGETVLLQSAKPVPLVSGMLKVLSWRWDPCGFDNDGIIPDAVVLGPGETTWVTAIVQPLVACPGPAPLQFQVTYSINSQETSFTLPGFPDLSAVHYSDCPASAS